MIKKRHLCLILSLATCSLIGTGFSSWTITYQNGDSAFGTIGVDTDVKDIIKGIYYVSNSSYFFDYFLLDNTYHLTTSSIGFKIAMYNSIFEQNDFSEDIYLYLNLSYTYNGASDFDIFSFGNNLIETPKYIKAMHNDNNMYFINSSEISTYSSSENNIHTHAIAVKFLAYSNDKPSLYSLKDRFVNSNENISYFNISLDFTITDTANQITTPSNFTKYLSSTFNFSFNIEERNI